MQRVQGFFMRETSEVSDGMKIVGGKFPYIFIPFSRCVNFMRIYEIHLCDNYCFFLREGENLLIFV
jgi:hypothetical protein